ncbi:glycosyltransferase family 1 protein [Chryseobacterium carnipullorum]|uniref:GDP-mannose-dependent alpha-(1-6)-phosphatidylinositol monomannoside mannosyltransferase n=1 Tax=Chryseobacterium carnipullorum TaxID=1124835 RepID=A0A376DQW7_CHRCU|nr:glycosyltransferase family 4 protein [Chryseobacterium carnipullorum]AZA48835.1 glycosyltransferase family 1 protein [Chryseobacterium carnipullorum]AZA63744.1 glycosyltransferase family 1 protein [Chryseobacterium carnipullorum]STC93320.1 GDP-mannose-dependent alpha-(1-6)-phosphatidylinositol monomannoside mannosyltransferase [Chryseobacterium carnipullorum]
MNKNILHVVSVSFSISFFVGEQFNYFNANDLKYNFFVACSPARNVSELSDKYGFKSYELDINRAITPIEDLKAIYKLRKFIIENNITTVVGHTPKGGMIAMLAATLAGVESKIYFRHGLVYETSKGIKKILLTNIERLSGNLANKVICVSNGIKQKSITDRLNNKSKNIILGKGTCNGVDCYNKYNPDNIDKTIVAKLKQQYSIDENNVVFGFVGRLVTDKGINELLEAWLLFSKNNTNAKLLLVGPLEKRDAISDQSLNIIRNTKTIIHVGEVEDTSVFYSLMDVFVLPSYREGFPTVVLEASSMRLPVITTNATGCNEAVIENETGIITKTITAEDISKCLEFFMENAERRKEFGQRGRDFVVENFEQTKIWKMIKKELL